MPPPTLRYEIESQLHYNTWALKLDRVIPSF